MKLKTLRRDLEAGVDALGRDEFVEFDAAGLKRYLKTLAGTTVR